MTMTGSPTRSIFALDGDTNDQIAWDETLFGYGTGDDVFDDDIAALFQGLKYKYLVVVLEQCFSGGMIRDVTQSTVNRLVISAAGEY